MILVDTTVWVGHLRARDAALVQLLDTAMVLTHPFIIGEIALGHLNPRELILRLLARLPTAQVATDVEALTFIDKHKLVGLGSVTSMSTCLPLCS